MKACCPLGVGFKEGIPPCNVLHRISTGFAWNIHRCKYLFFSDLRRTCHLRRDLALRNMPGILAVSAASLSANQARKFSIQEQHMRSELLGVIWI